MLYPIHICLQYIAIVTPFTMTEMCSFSQIQSETDQIGNTPHEVLAGKISLHCLECTDQCTIGPYDLPPKQILDNWT